MNAFARYSRQIVLREVGVNGQQLLRDSSVLLIGIGGLGAAAAPYLAGAGIGRLLLSDRDRVEASNLQRQILYRQSDVGRSKLDAAVQSLRALNPQCAVEALPGPLSAAGLAAAVRGVDIVLDCSDNFATRAAVNAACCEARKPLVSGAAMRFEGQVALFDLARGGACYACVFGDMSDAAQETCEEAGVIGPAVGVIGSMQALLALKRLIGIGDDAGKLQLWDALHLSWSTLRLVRNAQCPVCAGQAA